MIMIEIIHTYSNIFPTQRLVKLSCHIRCQSRVLYNGINGQINLFNMNFHLYSSRLCGGQDIWLEKIKETCFFIIFLLYRYTSFNLQLYWFELLLTDFLNRRNLQVSSEVEVGTCYGHLLLFCQGVEYRLWGLGPL